MKKISLSICLLVVTLSGFCKTWILSNNDIDIHFDDRTGQLTVKDKRCQKIWKQSPFKEKWEIGKVKQNGHTLMVSFKERYEFEVTFTLKAPASLEISLVAPAQIPFNNIIFPSAFMSPDKDHYLLQTDGEGLLLPVDDKIYPMGTERPFFCGGGLAMPWMGITDKQFKTGYMAILETPYDATLNTMLVNGYRTFAPLWMPSMEKFGYKRKVTFHFFDKGGYVAQCKKYRSFIWEKHKMITLRTHEKNKPALSKMMGAPHIYVWDNARDVSFAKELKQSGIDKAMIFWDANHTPYPEKDYDSRLKELGYAAAIYELFTDLKLRDTAHYILDENGPLRFALTAYPGLFHQLAARKKDGTTYSNQFGHTSCPLAIRQQMIKRVARELKEYPHEAYFLDVYQANGLFECYSPEHPLTREQFAMEVNKNYQIIAEQYGQYMGGEWGADFTGSNSVFVHGMMTLQRTWWGSGIEKKGTIYYTGDWKSNPRPTQMIGTRVANDKYLQYAINEYSRVPLYELVYHDAVVTSWRWEDGNHHTPEIWWKKDLFNILYGSAPLWNMDRDRWESYKHTFIESYRKVCPWLQKIGYDEMISHRFVTADHTIQESVFESGKIAVVNFSNKEYLYKSRLIPAKGYITIE